MRERTLLYDEGYNIIVCNISIYTHTFSPPPRKGEMNHIVFVTGAQRKIVTAVGSGSGRGCEGGEKEGKEVKGGGEGAPAFLLPRCR